MVKGGDAVRNGVLEKKQSEAARMHMEELQYQEDRHQVGDHALTRSGEADPEPTRLTTKLITGNARWRLIPGKSYQATRTSRTLGCEVKVFFTVDNNDNEDNEELGMKITVTSVTPPEAE